MENPPPRRAGTKFFSQPGICSCDCPDFLPDADSLPDSDRSQWGVDSGQIQTRKGGGRACLASLLSASSFSAACLCLLFLLAPAPLAAQEPAGRAEEPAAKTEAVGPLAAVRGVVLTSATGQPLARALVRIEGDAATGALTDGEGRFEIPGVPVGPQIFQVLKPGFRDPEATANGGEEEQESAEHNVLVAAPMPELAFTLTPNCAIRGHVELSTGDPAGAVLVRLLRQSIRNGRAVWGEVKNRRTDAQGEYRFGGLPEGVYAVYNDPMLESIPATTLVEPGSGGSVARNGYPTVFYPEARELAAAALIRLTAGDQAQADLTLTLEPFHTVTATVLSPGGRTLTLGNDGAAPEPSLMDTEGHTLPYPAHYDEATHTVQATLPDGSYTLSVVMRDSASAEAAPSRAHPGFLVGSAPFTVAGKAVRNLQIPLFRPHSSLLQLRAQRSAAGGQAGVFPSAGLGSAVRVSLESADEYRVLAGEEKTAPNAGPEAFDLMLAPPFSYWVHTLVYGKGLCAGALNANGVNLAREPLLLSYSGSATAMELAVRNDCARLNLGLPATVAALAPGIEPVYTVYVVPEFDTTADVQPVTLRPSSGGSLTVEGLTPGSYRVYTFAAPVELEYRNPAAMAKLSGQAVTLAPGGSANLVVEAPGR
jgi:hypothetical protein